MNKKNIYITNDAIETRIGGNISWAAIFAGAVTFVAMMFLLSFIGAAIGLGTLDFHSSNPVDGLFTGVGIWTAVQLLISLFVAGFVSGLAARRVGLLHGFLSWALSLAMIVVMVVSVLTATLRTAGNLVGGATEITGQAVSKITETVGKGLGDLGETAFNEISKQVEGVDSEKLQADMKEYLKDTENEKLRPEYLQTQIDKSVDEMAQAAKDIALNPNDAENIVKKVAEDIQARAKDIAQSVSQEDINKAVSKNSDLSEAEVQEISKNIYDGLQKTYAQAEKTFSEASVKVTEVYNEAKTTVANTVEDVKDTADDVASTTSSASIWTFVGLLLGAVVAMFGGVLGSRISEEKFFAEN